MVVGYTGLVGRKMNQILLTYDDSWNHEELMEVAELYEHREPGVLKADVVEHCGKCGENKTSFRISDGYKASDYINLQESVKKLSKWIMERDEEAIVEHFAKVDMPGLLRMKDCINNAIEKVSGVKVEPVCPKCGAEHPHLCLGGTWLCDECRHQWSSLDET
jgi:hypothetical protein